MKDSPSPVQLETDRLLLTIPGPQEASHVLSYYRDNDAHLARWEPPHPPGFFSLKYWQERLSMNREEYARGLSMRLAFRNRETPSGPIVGVANYSQFVRGGFQACYLGYSLDHRREGQGLMTEALRASNAFVFRDLALHRIMANYIPGNRRSAAVLRRLGFQIEGYAPAYLFIDGRWQDHILTALLNPDVPNPD